MQIFDKSTRTLLNSNYEAQILLIILWWIFCVYISLF